MSYPAEYERSGPQRRQCASCARWFGVNDANHEPQVVCRRCGHRLPPALIKATCDPFFYAAKLRTGEVLTFERATLHGDYVRLIGSEVSLGDLVFGDSELPFPCPRGVDIRLTDIVWCADAPRGS